ncbi:phosphatidylinositol alpha-1,6-mannosyltransferase [Nakamurella panacisegetis]|uniref:phosphatidyl-myo-inositol dimannoside synthase n=1 Tax=Nakamurella panacisegetis TaxID=1090615 RepID=A0A1H0R3E4_9ACTN|nr:phosphatidylinositol alpha-1,6-mannosyltransferase [Nakamurella panacisegetis]
MAFTPHLRTPYVVAVRRTLLVTNDFPPRAGGIQSYVQALAVRMPAADLVVYAPAWAGAEEFDAAQDFEVVRHPSSLMLPVPSVARRAKKLIERHRLEAVWFGAAAPLALLTPTLRRAGIVRAVASTHGHEVGWSMLPGSRQALRAIGREVDVVTFVSRYARRRIAAALGPTAALEYLPAGVDTTVFRPDPGARTRVRSALGLGQRPVVACISRLVARKGQDMLIRALPGVLESVPDAVLLVVGGGPDADALRRLADDVGVAENVTFVGSVPWPELPAHYAAADVFAMPCRTRGGGLDVEGLGIVFLEASAMQLPVVAGDSGGAPEAVLPGRTGLVVGGRDVDGIAQAISGLLLDRERSARMGAAGREWITERWNWQRSADRLADLLSR